MQCQAVERTPQNWWKQRHPPVVVTAAFRHTQPWSGKGGMQYTLAPLRVNIPLPGKFRRQDTKSGIQGQWCRKQRRLHSTAWRFKGAWHHGLEHITQNMGYCQMTYHTYKKCTVSRRNTASINDSRYVTCGSRSWAMPGWRKGKIKEDYPKKDRPNRAPHSSAFPIHFPDIANCTINLSARHQRTKKPACPAAFSFKSMSAIGKKTIDVYQIPHCGECPISKVLQKRQTPALHQCALGTFFISQWTAEPEAERFAASSHRLNFRSLVSQKVSTTCAVSTMERYWDR
jgi:hypothetical protein